MVEFLYALFCMLIFICLQPETPRRGVFLISYPSLLSGRREPLEASKLLSAVRRNSQGQGQTEVFEVDKSGLYTVS